VASLRSGLSDHDGRNTHEEASLEAEGHAGAAELAEGALQFDDVEERQVEPDQHEPEVELAEPLVEEPAEGLGPPVVSAGHQREDRPAEQDVVQVGHDEVAVRLLQVHRRGGMHDPRESAHREHGNEAEREAERAAEPDPAAPQRRQPVQC
jgi:hypothetical protein